MSPAEAQCLEQLLSTAESAACLYELITNSMAEDLMSKEDLDGLHGEN